MANYDPAKEACSPNETERIQWLKDRPYPIIGPGGKTNIVENNEKGILDTAVLACAKDVEYAALGSDHDSHRQGIYATNSMGDND